MPHIQIVMGGGVALTANPNPPELLDILEKEGVKKIDTARMYGKSEEILGDLGAPSRFVIDTKSPGGWTPGSLKPEVLISNAKESLQRLKTDQVDIYYFHAPDVSVPLADQLKAVNELHQSGVFKRFGLSNFTVPQLYETYDHCKANGYVLPTVYQGAYNPIARHIEADLLPTLRKLGMAFYAYSPVAGGFLTKTKDEILASSGAGRFNSDHANTKMWTGLYVKPTLLAGLEAWEAVAKDEGCSKSDLANRWVAWNPVLKAELGDALIVGANGADRLRASIKAVKAGPPSESAMKRIDEIWETVKNDAPVDNFDLHRSGTA